MSTITIKARKYVRDSTNGKLIDALSRALEHHGASLDLREEMQPRTGGMQRFWNVWEYISREDAGAHVLHIPARELRFDQVSYLIIQKYARFRIRLLSEEGIPLDDMDATEITNPTVVFSDLLFQHIAETLADRAHGDNKIRLVNACITFITDPAVQEIFIEKRLFREERIGRFFINLTNEFQSILSEVTEMVERNNLIHRNAIAIDAACEDLERIGYSIKARIIACIDPNAKAIIGRRIEPARFGPLVIDGTLLECEAPRVPDGVDTDRTAAIINNLEDDAILRCKVGALYALCESNKNLRSILSSIKNIIDNTGWIGVLFDVFDFEALLTKLREHYVEYRNTIVFPPELAAYEENPGLLQHPLIILDLQAIRNLEGLRQLNEITSQQIRDDIEVQLLAAFNNVIQTQENNLFDCHFINPEQVASLRRRGLLPAPPTPDREAPQEQRMLPAANPRAAVTPLYEQTTIAAACIAARRGDTDTIEMLCNDNFNFDRLSNAIYWQGQMTPFAIAVKCGNVRIVEILINRAHANPFILCGGYRSWIARELRPLGKTANNDSIIELLERYEQVYHERASINNVIPVTVEDAARAAYQGNIGWIRALRVQGCDFTSRTQNYGRTIIGNQPAAMLEAYLPYSAKTPLEIARERLDSTGDTKYREVCILLQTYVATNQPGI